jgi:hypothetical protein
MAKMITLTKRDVDDFKIVITGASKNYTKTFARADYSDTESGIKLIPYVGTPLMFEYFTFDQWTIDGVTNFADNAAVTYALTSLAIQ